MFQLVVELLNNILIPNCNPFMLYHKRGWKNPPAKFQQFLTAKKIIRNSRKSKVRNDFFVEISSHEKNPNHENHKNNVKLEENSMILMKKSQRIKTLSIFALIFRDFSNLTEIFLRNVIRRDVLWILIIKSP